MLHILQLAQDSLQAASPVSCSVTAYTQSSFWSPREDSDACCSLSVLHATSLVAEGFARASPAAYLNDPGQTPRN
ncbi:hypothetical protein E2C01_102115 [Portunus trituberculatus]|uniref:Uncharacterized protein n=1 Tax=Portunus trituberculatus TaxID=210409 RepID=A0A5B7KGI3_PORTR|nr:hypothetical protein [Portunus trituberculatus]